MREINLLEGKVVAREIKVGIVAARFNEFIVSKLVSGALDGLKRHDVKEEDIDIAWVPGAFEIPLIADKMAKSKKYDAAANFISQGCVALFGANEGSCVGVGNAVAEDGNNIVAAGMDKSDAVIQLIKDGALICTMAQNPDVMGYEGMYAAITAINDGKVAPEYIDTGVSILNLDAVK